jgi:hypothetical protein
MGGEGEFTKLLDLLRDHRSPKRRMAAKKLRKLRDPRACEALLHALANEISDERTWETQYQMIMALGECGCKEALPLLNELATRPFFHTMVLIAIGDALVRVRVSLQFQDDPGPILDLISHAGRYQSMLLQGAMRAVATLQQRFEPDVAEHLIQRVVELNDDGIMFWTAAACPAWNWRSGKIQEFLKTCIAKAPWESMRNIAAAALQGRFVAVKQL